MNIIRQNNFDKTYLEVAKIFSQLSRAERAKVGAIIVKDNNIISFGYNGTPSGRDNCCEFINEDGKKETKSEVVHAEMNAIAKTSNSMYLVKGSTLYLTLSPCVECCKLIIQVGISRIVYLEEYRDTSGFELLRSVGIEIEKFKELTYCQYCEHGGRTIYNNTLYKFKESHKKKNKKIIKINYLEGDLGCRLSERNNKENLCIENNFSEFKELQN